MSITEVAKLAGVSSATVSRVVNRQSGVSVANIGRVKNAIKQLGYRPQRSAARQALAARPTYALLYLTRQDFYSHSDTSAQTVEGIRHELARLNINLIVSDATSVQELPPLVRRQQVDGLFVTGSNPDPKVLEKIKGIPTVWLTSHHEDRGDAMLPGNEHVGRIAANYLNDKGCKHLAALNAMSWSLAVGARINFFCYMSQQLGLGDAQKFLAEGATDDAHCGQFDETFEASVAKLVDQMLASPQRPDGLFVPVDLQTAIVHRLLLQRGVQPGRDMLLIGSDHIRSALTGLWPRPATVSLRSYMVGRMAVEQLRRRVADPKRSEDGVQVTIQPVLVPGEDWRQPNTFKADS